MKKIILVTIVTLLSIMLAMPAIAKNDKDKQHRNKAYEKAAKIQDKRVKDREKVDKLMKERLKLIKQNNPGKATFGS